MKGWTLSVLTAANVSVSARRHTQTQTHTYTQRTAATKHVVATCQALQSNATVWVQPAVCRNKNVAREWRRVSCRLFVWLSFFSFTSLFSPFFPSFCTFFVFLLTAVIHLHLHLPFCPHLSVFMPSPTLPYPSSHTSGELGQNKTKPNKKKKKSIWIRVA